MAGTLLSMFTAVATAEVLLDFQFDERRGQGLTRVADSAGGAVWNQGGSGIATSGDGVMRLRRSRDGAGLYHAPVSPETDQPVWLVVEVRSWNLTGPADEALRFGLAADTPANQGLADIRLQRLESGEIQMEGRGHGRGSSRIPPRPVFANPRTEPLTLALEVVPARNLYRIYYREGSGAWQRFGEGRTDPSRRIAQVRLNVANRFDSTPEEHFDLDRMTVTLTSPLDGATPAAAPAPGRAAPAPRGSTRPARPTPAPAPTPTVEEEEASAGAGPRGITAVTWAVANAETGEILAAHLPHEGRKNASITKVMCALVVGRLAAADPSILDERVTFSAAALSPTGTKTGLVEGESMTVRETLYGLLLPSGNDAGNALAEHFNDRLPPAPEGMTGNAARRNFVAAMNARAAELGMTNTTYRIAFGDGGTAQDTTSTAADLIQLGRAAVADPLVRQVASTRGYTATVTTPDGSTRRVTWTNTNQLLGPRGFDGIKTGTTRTAGACLLATAERNGVRLVTVVLGSASRDERFSDTERLAGWAFQQVRRSGRGGR